MEKQRSNFTGGIRQKIFGMLLITIVLVIAAYTTVFFFQSKRVEQLVNDTYETQKQVYIDNGMEDEYETFRSGAARIVQMMAKHGMGFNLPWKGAVLLPAVMVWYLLSEAGSIIENCAKLGANVPDWLRKGIKEAQKKADAPPAGWEMEHSATEDE